MAELWEEIAPFCPGVTTERGRQDACYRARAIGTLGFDGKYPWILPAEDAVHRGAKMRVTVLNQLGRLDDDEMHAAARHISDQKLGNKEAIAYIRGRKGINARPAKFSEIVSVIANAIDAYHESHEVDLTVLKKALEHCYRAVAKTQENAQ